MQGHVLKRGTTFSTVIDLSPGTVRFTHRVLQRAADAVRWRLLASPAQGAQPPTAAESRASGAGAASV